MSADEKRAPDQSKDPDNWRAAQELYKQVCAEVVRYRDMEWKVPAWTLALLGATMGVRYPDVAALQYLTCMKIAVIIVILFVAISGSWHLHFIHRELTINRNVRRTLERSLGLSDATRNGGVPLIPAKWSEGKVPYSQGLGHLVSWWVLIAVVAIYTVLVAAFGLGPR